MNKNKLIVEMTKSAPPISLSLFDYLGAFSLQDWMYISAITYTIMQIVVSFIKIIKRKRKRP